MKNKIATIILALFLMSFTHGHRGHLLCSIDNKKVSIFINSIICTTYQ